ncbi:hypothetical protein [Streptomyces sp. NRRL S-646]|uniref:hypothetical protein n=1 Tax=Streptomyces sp. NRRL S-646 TaxID=1463917 RepID=UPI0013319190|nr:hypothetical protein [Streptomyces sp. NRRL S-646]
MMRVQGDDHPHTLATREDLAYWREQAGDAPECDELLDLGDDYFNTMHGCHNEAS